MPGIVSIGIQDFAQMRRNNKFYVDKTDFIKKWWERGDLFEGLSVWEEEKYRELQGAYPVISLSFAGVKSDNYAGARFQIFELVKMLWKKYPEIEPDENLSLIQGQLLFQALIQENILPGKVNRNAFTMALCWGFW